VPGILRVNRLLGEIGNTIAFHNGKQIKCVGLFRRVLKLPRYRSRPSCDFNAQNLGTFHSDQIACSIWRHRTENRISLLKQINGHSEFIECSDGCGWQFTSKWVQNSVDPRRSFSAAFRRAGFDRNLSSYRKGLTANFAQGHTPIITLFKTLYNGRGASR